MASYAEAIVRLVLSGVVRAKTKALEESAESKVMYEEVLRAMRDYSGAGDPDEY